MDNGEDGDLLRKLIKFGDALLTKGAESVNQKTFQSYDRMLPAQDHMPDPINGNSSRQ